MLKDRLSERKLPEVQKAAARKEILELFCREEYGFTPTAPDHVTAEILEEKFDDAIHANCSQVRLSFDTPGGLFSFNVSLTMPVAEGPIPMFVLVSFNPAPSHQSTPVELITGSGYGLAAFDYQEITSDKPCFDKMAALYPRDEETGWGTIGMWAFAASRVMDYLQTRDDVDKARIAVIGHSRLGKTALWCAAQDPRFSLAISNDSGCSGAAVSRGKKGETIDAITDPERFRYWFCRNYRRWANREYDAPFDQHQLLALMAPRHLYVCSAIKDDWADPDSEYLSCAAATPAWEEFGIRGLIGPEKPETDAYYHEGHIGYHVRQGGHALNEFDWQADIAYRQHHGI